MAQLSAYVECRWIYQPFISKLNVDRLELIELDFLVLGPFVYFFQLLVAAYW